MNQSFAGITDLKRLASTRIGVFYSGLDPKSGRKVFLLKHESNLNTGLADSIYRNEFEITQLPLSAIQLESQDLVRHSSELFIKYKFFDAELLQNRLEQGVLNVEEFFDCSLKIVESLVKLHSQSIIHGNLNPTSILINQESCRFFSFRDRYKLTNPQYRDSLDIHYISPEQTGRVSQAIDHRSDLYSLGICFYQLLTGKLPFIGQDEQSIIHAHLALRPKEPRELNPQVPSALSVLVARLLEKDPEARYQSARGLLGDLHECQELYLKKGQAFQFLPRTQNYADCLVFPEVLFGREKELAALKQALANTFKQKSCLSIIVESRAGLGKTQIVNALVESVSDNEVFVLRGQSERGSYSSLSSLLQNFVQQYQKLTAPEQVSLSQTFATSMAEGELEQLQLIVPEIKKLAYFPEPESSLLSTEKLRDAFFRCFTLLASFRFLVLNLENIHDCDRESLSVLRQLLDEASGEGLLVISTLDLNSDSGAKSSLDLQTFLKRSVLLHLKNLNLEHVRLFIEKTLQIEDIENFSEIIYEKTMGNPSHIRYLLEELVEEEVLIRRVESGQWSFDLDRLRARKVMDSVAEILVGRALQLQGELREIALNASCLLDRFSPQMLSSVCKLELAQTYQAIQVLLSQGILSQDDYNQFSFAHENIRRTLYDSLSFDQKQSLHAQLARAGLSLEQSQSGQDLAILAHHIEKSGPHVQGEEAALVCVEAAQARMRLSEWSDALVLLDRSIELIPGNDRISFSIRILQAQCLRARGEFKYAAEILSDLRSYSHDDLNRVQILVEEVRLKKDLNEVEVGLKLALEALSCLNPGFKPSLSRVKKWRLLWGLARSVNKTPPKSAKERVKIRLNLEVYSLIILMSKHCTPSVFEFCLLEGARLQIETRNNDFNFLPLCAFYLIENNEMDLFEKIFPRLRWAGAFWPGNYSLVLEQAHMFTGSSVPESIHCLGKLMDSALENKDWKLAVGAMTVYFESKFYSGQSPKEIEAEIQHQVRSHSNILDGSKELSQLIDFFRMLSKKDSDAEITNAQIGLRNWFLDIVVMGDVQKMPGEEMLITSSSARTFFGVDLFVLLFSQSIAEFRRGNLIKAREILQKFDRLSKFTLWNVEAPKAILEALCYKNVSFEVGVSLFEKAMNECQKLGNRILLGLACEEAAHFYNEFSCQNISQSLLEKSLRYYEEWGGERKVQKMLSDFPSLRKEVVAQFSDSSNIDLQTITQATHYITSEMEMAPLIEKLLRTLVESAGATHGSLFLVEENQAILKADCYYNEELIYRMTPKDQLREAAALIPERLTRGMLNRQRLIVIDDASKDQLFSHDPMVVQAGFRSILCLPIVSSGELKAFVCLRNDFAPGFFTTDRIKTLEILSGQAAIAVENAELYESLTEKVRMETELVTAGHVHSMILPEACFESDEISIQGKSESATESGGDWWYYNQIENKLTLCIGDATGHGVSAALITSAVRSAVSVLETLDGISLIEIMNRLNHVIQAAAKGEVAMTFFIARLDLETGEMECCNASHPIPYRVTGARLGSLLVNPGPMLGQSIDGIYTVEKFKLMPDDQLLFFTDGLTELTNLKGKMLGDAKLARHLRNNIEQSIETFQGLEKLIEDFAQGQGLADDLTYYVLKFKNYYSGAQRKKVS